jgi:hypothetical protein
MAVFCSYNIDWEELKKSNPVETVVMPYTREEEGWLNEQLQLMDEAYRSLPMGEDFIEEFMMFSLDVPLSKHYLQTATAMGLERIRRISKTQEEFLDLPSKVHSGLLIKNSLKALSLVICKAENCADGAEQLKMSFSSSDEKHWKEKYETVFGGKKLKKMSFMETSDDLQLLLSDKEKKEICAIFSNVSNLTKDPVIYGLLILLILTKPEESLSGRQQHLAKLNSKYKILMERRLTSSLTYNFSRSYLDPNQNVLQVFQGLHHADRLSNTLNFISSSFTV